MYKIFHIFFKHLENILEMEGKGIYHVECYFI